MNLCAFLASHDFARLWPHGPRVDVARVVFELFGPNGKAVPEDVRGARNGEIHVAPSAHVDESRECRLARKRSDVAKSLLDVGLPEAAEDLDRDVGVFASEFLQDGREAPCGKARCRGKADIAFESPIRVHERFDE